MYYFMEKIDKIEIFAPTTIMQIYSIYSSIPNMVSPLSKSLNVSAAMFT